MVDEPLDPAAELRADIEQAVEAQQAELQVEEPGGKIKTLEPVADEKAEPPRDEKGRFASKEAGESIEKSVEPVQKFQEPVDGQPAVGTPETPKEVPRPPPGFSVTSKTAWDSLPQFVRDDIVKREQEVDAGFRRYGGLGKFAEEAERNGTTLQAAVNDYVGVETALRQDFIGGIEHICQRMSVDPRILAQAMTSRYSAPRQAEADGVTAQPAPAPDLMAIASHVANVLREETEQREINSKIASFMANPKNRFFANLRQDMAQIVQAGKANTLEQAYEAACWLNPEIRHILINETLGGRDKEAAAAISRSRNAAKAVGGSPAPGVNPDAGAKRQNLNLEDEIRAVVDAQIGTA